jgi:sugar lactone lactonase YvrE
MVGTAMGWTRRRSLRFLLAFLAGLLGMAVLVAFRPLPVGAVSGARVFVVSDPPASVSEYPPGATGNAGATRTISGSSTGLGGSTGVALDPAGTLYVTNWFRSCVTEYAAGVGGDVIPTRTIVGPSTGLQSPNGVTRDARGTLYVANHDSSITEYAAGADGDARPVRTIAGSNTGLWFPYGVVVDPTGLLYVANRESITEYAAGASGNVAPVRTIAGPGTGLGEPRGLVLDAAGNLYVSNEMGDSITEYAAGASGDARPIRTISGPTTGLAWPDGLALDAEGTLYVANNSGSTITAYPAGANGDARPSRTITGVQSPVAVAVAVTPSAAAIPPARTPAPTPAPAHSSVPSPSDQAPAPASSSPTPDGPAPDRAIAGPVTGSRVDRAGTASPPPSTGSPAVFRGPPISPSAPPLLLQHALVVAAVVSMTLIAFPAELFNSTVKDNYDEIRGWFRWLRLPFEGMTALQRVAGRGWTACALVAVLAAALYTPVIGRLERFHDASPWSLYLGTLAGLVVVTASLDLPAMAYLRLRHREQALVRAFPATLLFAGISLVIVLAAHLHVGYLYGLVAGYALKKGLTGTEEEPRAEEGRAVALSCLVMFVVSLSAWALRPTISALLGGHHTAGIGTAVNAMLAMVIGGGLETVIFGLVPLTFLDGATVRRWSRLAWRALFILGLWLLASVLLSEEDVVTTGPALTVLVPFVLFGVLSVLFWGYFFVGGLLTGRRGRAAPSA